MLHSITANQVLFLRESKIFMSRTLDQTPSNIDPQRLRRVLGKFPTGVAIVTGWDADRRERLGMTISSFNSVSMRPPLVLFSISRRAYSFASWVRLPGYAISILSQEQQYLSDRFSQPLSGKWDGVSFRNGLFEAPLIDDAAAYLECLAYRQYDGGDHIIFIGQVQNLWHGDAELPLVFYQGQYASLNSPQRPVPA